MLQDNLLNYFNRLAYPHFISFSRSPLSAWIPAGVLALILVTTWSLTDCEADHAVYAGLLMSSIPGFLRKSPEKLESFQWIDLLPLPSIVVEKQESRIIAINKKGMDLLAILSESDTPLLLSSFLHGGMHPEDWSKFVTGQAGEQACNFTNSKSQHFASNFSWKEISVEPDSLILCQFSEVQQISIFRRTSLMEVSPKDASSLLEGSLRHNLFDISQKLLSNYPIPLCITSPDGGYCWYATEQAGKLFAQSGNEFYQPPRWWEANVIPEEQRRLSLVWQELALSGKAETTLRVINPGHEISTIKWRAIAEYDTSGNQSLIYHYFSEELPTPITEWSEKVRSIENQHSGIAKWAWDRKRGTVNWSPEFYKLHRLTGNEQPDASLPFPYLDEDSRFDLKILLETMSDSHLPLSTEYKVRLPDGTVKEFILVVADIITGISGETEYLSGIIQDVSNDKEQHKIQLELTDELSRMKQLVKEFSTALSHRLRVPVAQLQGILSVVLNTGGISREKQWEYLQECAYDLDAAVHEMNELLNTDKGVDGVSESISWHEIWQPIAVEFQETVIDIKASLGVDFSAAPKVVAVKENLQGIVGELLKNAIRFRDHGRLLELHAYTEIVDGKVWFHLQDNGLGMDLHGRTSSPFEIYKRFHSDRSGKGFGLHLVKLWIESIEGEVAITSIPNQGTRVSFGIPYCEEE